MKFSRTLASSALVLVAAFVVASSASYRHQPPRGPHGASRYNPVSHRALAHYGGGNCYGRNCHQAARQANSNYGPYHSYAVRPAIYGGRGLYAYRGYARYPPAPRGRHGAQLGYRVPQGHASHSKCAQRGPRYANSNNHNSNSNYNANSNRHAQPQHNIGGQNYLLRPVKALVLAPAGYQTNNHNNNNNNNNHHHGASSHAKPAPGGHNQRRARQHYQASRARQYAGHAAPAYQAHNRRGHGNGLARRPASGGY